MVELFCRNSQRVIAVDFFCRRAPSWMFDRILNVTLSNNLLQFKGLRKSFPQPGLHKGVLDSPCLPILLVYNNQKNKIKSQSNTRSKNIKNLSTRQTRQIRLTRATNCRAVAHKSWVARFSLRTAGFQLKQQAHYLRLFFFFFFILYYNFITYNQPT